MRPKLQKRSAVKLAGRIILHKQGIIPRSGLAELFPKLALGFIPVIKEVKDVGHSAPAAKNILLIFKRRIT